ncbi:peptidoglycan DD-metalloendopeptidase family protein [Sporosarcina sp. Te-1]|nr:peptidoglycan DD-metalloendopeptidase family protein [Sporosarcina sp. Te-1]
MSTLLGGTGALASTLKDLKQEQKQNEQKRKNLNATIENKDKAIQSTRSDIQKFLDQVAKVNREIKETNDNMNRVIDNINKTQDEIDELKASIKDLEKKIAERDEVLRERVRAMQAKGGNVNYIDVLLGANSFADFIDRFSAVSTLMDADRDIMKRQKEDIEQLEKEKALVEKKLAELEQNKAQLEKLKARLLDKKKEKHKIIDQLEAEEERLSKEKQEVEAEFHEAVEIGAELEKKVIAEQKRAAEIARKEEERKRKEREAARANSNKIPQVSDGFWTRPANGTFTSSFGWRTHPIFGTKRQHRGVDIANSIGTPVVAAADGVVSYAGKMGGLGNCVMITHSSDGQILTTVYGHMSRIDAHVGQVIDKGTQVGAIGTTGNSTGPHLHFEIHIGSFSASGPSAVNPLRYVSF